MSERPQIRRRAALVASTLAALYTCVVCAVSWAQDAKDDEAEQAARRAASALRPYEAPLLGDRAELPPLPPEYLSHDEAGIQFAYHPSARDRVRELIEEAPEIRRQLSRQLGMEVLSDLKIRVAVGSADFSRVVPEGAPLGSGAMAFAELDMLVMNLRAGSPLAGSDVRSAFRRGMALLALDEATAMRGLPRWFRIGYALEFADQAPMSRSRSLWWASMQQKLIPLVDLDWYLSDRRAHGSVAAAEAADFVRYLMAEGQPEQFHRLLAQIRDDKASFDTAMRGAYQNDLDGLETAWREDLAKHKAFLPILFGGTALWLFLALGVHLRRRFRRKGEVLGGEPASVARASRVLSLPKPKPKPKRVAEPPPKAEPAEPEVPKVSHNGRWHTLH